MNIRYSREMKHNYLIIRPDEAGNHGFELSMMEKNSIEGLLRFHVKSLDNENEYYYEITSKQSLSRILEYKSLGEEDLKRLVYGIGETLSKLEVYLLKEDQILLEPEYIYIEPERFKVFLCLIPGRKGSFTQEMTGLLRYLLGKVNHQDKECVVIAYGLYQESLKENYGIYDLLKITEKQSGYEGPPEEDYKKDNTKENSDETFFQREIKPPKNTVEDHKANHLIKTLVASIFAIAGVFFASWLIFGMSKAIELWYLPLAAGCATAVLLFFGGGNTQEKDNTSEETHEWQMTFVEEEEERKPLKTVEKERKPPKTVEKEDVLQTVLLTDTTEDLTIPCLRAITSEASDITISYVPYIIGKQEGLVDYVLEGEAISRVHARIDKKGEEYQLCDLNSTNGIIVNGYMLETNETVTLKKGDEIFIANFGFVFT